MTDAQPTFLTAEQIWGDKALDIMKRCGTTCMATDLAKILGAWVESGQNADWWSASSDRGVGNVRCCGDWFACMPLSSCLAGRPALPPSFTSSIRPSEARQWRKIEKFDVIQYGEYPQIAATAHEQSQLYDLRNSGKLYFATTDKKYTFNLKSTYYLKGTYATYDEYNYVNFSEYEHNGNRYVCVPARPVGPKSQTHYGETIEKGKDYWVRVTPIEWLVDPSGWWVALNGLFSGMPFDYRTRYDGNFANTEIAKYLKNTFAKQMLSNTISHAANDNRQQFADAVQPITHDVTATDKPTPVAQQISPNANDNNSVAKRIWKFFRGKNR